MTATIDATIYSHVCALFPIFRSITGSGLRETLRYVADQTGAEIKEVASGTPVLDWIVPREWTVRSGQIRRMSGEAVIDMAVNNLHLLQYSHGIDAVMSRADLDAHLHSLPDQPELIPYRTAYYADDWGFCLSQNQRDALTDEAYHVVIDADLAPGALTYAELVLEGSADEEMLLSVHCCHPSLANDNLSSIAIAIELAKWVAAQPRRRLTYRFVFLPGTIGAIVWLAQHPHVRDHVKHGLVLSCLGDIGPPTYKQSRRGQAPIDRTVAHILAQRGHTDRIRPFVPYGYDERQYCSPGFDLPVGCLMRSANGTFAQYHTSADNLSFVKPAALADSLEILTAIVTVVEANSYPLNLSPYGEPQLGRRGLYAAIGGQTKDAPRDGRFDQLTLLWILNQADGTNSLMDIAERSQKGFTEIAAGAAALEEAGLLSLAWSRANIPV